MITTVHLTVSSGQYHVSCKGFTEVITRLVTLCNTLIMPTKEINRANNTASIGLKPIVLDFTLETCWYCNIHRSYFARFNH